MRPFKGIFCHDISEIAVGTLITERPPPTEPSGPHSGTRLPPRVLDGEALLGPGMKDAGPGEKVIRQLRDPSPGRAVLGKLDAGAFEHMSSAPIDSRRLGGRYGYFSHSREKIS